MNAYKSAKEYAQDLISAIEKEDSKMPEERKTDPILLELFFSEIRRYADQCWLDALCGKRESFMISETELMELYNKAGRSYVSELIDDMVDDDILQAAIGKDGDILYSLTDKGKSMSKKYKGENDEQA